jgi:hypothetical protein
MKWKSLKTGGPNWYFATVPNDEFPLGKHKMQLGPGGAVSHFSLKLYSFMTMTLLVNFPSCPEKATPILSFLSGLTSIGIMLEPSTDLINVIVPYNTDGKARCQRLELIEKLTSRKRSDIIREAMFRFIKSDYPEFIVE